MAERSGSCAGRGLMELTGPAMQTAHHHSVAMLVKARGATDGVEWSPAIVYGNDGVEWTTPLRFGPLLCQVGVSKVEVWLDQAAGAFFKLGVLSTGVWPHDRAFISMSTHP